MFFDKRFDYGDLSGNKKWWKTSEWGRDYYAFQVLFIVATLALIIGYGIGVLTAEFVNQKSLKQNNKTIEKVLPVAAKKAAPVAVPTIEPVALPQQADESNNYIVPSITGQKG